jgi:hypothetical protein
VCREKISHFLVCRDKMSHFLVCRKPKKFEKHCFKGAKNLIFLCVIAQGECETFSTLKVLLMAPKNLQTLKTLPTHKSRARIPLKGGLRKGKSLSITFLSRCSKLINFDEKRERKLNLHLFSLDHKFLMQFIMIAAEELLNYNS